MLKVLRHKTVARTIFWGTLILILPAFVLWGTGNIGGGSKGPKFAGTINNKKISFEDLSASVTSVRSQLILNYFNQPNVLNSILNNKPLIAKLAWDRLIMVREAKKSRIKVADAEVINAISSHPIFNRGGRFDDKIYEYILRYNMGLSPHAFEEMIRENLAIQKMNGILTKDVKATDEDAKIEFLKESGRYKLSYVFFGLAGKLDKVNISDDAVKDYYEKFKGQIALKPKEGDDKAPARPAAFDEAKPDIKNFLAETEARKLAYDDAAGMYKNLTESMDKDKLSFEDAAAKLGLKVSQTPFMSKTEKIEDAGDAPVLAEILPVINAGELSRPIPTQKGVIILKVVETEKLDEEKFAKVKDEYMKKGLDTRKNAYLEDWLRGLEKKTTLNIDPKDLDKYFK